MRFVFACLVGLVSGGAVFLWTDAATACGGCFTGQTESTQGAPAPSLM